MREVGIEKVLYYRTKEFDSYCKGYPQTSETSLVDTIKKWEAQYRPHIEQLETRLLRLGKGDLARVLMFTHNSCFPGTSHGSTLRSSHLERTVYCVIIDEQCVNSIISIALEAVHQGVTKRDHNRLAESKNNAIEVSMMWVHGKPRCLHETLTTPPTAADSEAGAKIPDPIISLTAMGSAWVDRCAHHQPDLRMLYQ